MYNIHSHYENILAYVNTIVAESTLVYLHPFGATHPNNVESMQNLGFGPLIIAYDQEPLMSHYNDSLFKFINNNYKNGLGFPKSTILLNTERIGTEKNKIINKFNYIDVNYFFHGLAATDWYRGYQFNADITPVSARKIKKKYITFNRITGNSRVYRSFLIAELAKVNLLDYGHVSYSEVCPVHGHYHDSIVQALSVYNLNKNYITRTLDILSQTNLNLRIDTKELIPNGSQTIGPIKNLMESFLHVVTETCYWDERTHLTEKIFKPIVARQPFVLLGCAGNLKYLRSYGFQTFDAWWDESYDTITDPIQRLQAVIKIIQDICNMSNQDLESMLRGMNYVLEHNYNLFYSKKFVETIWKELTVNLQSAVAQLSPQTSLENQLR